MKEGRVVRFHEAGLCDVREAGTERLFVFTFDKIQNYSGETAEELGLRAGSVIYFTATDEGLVTRVELIADPVDAPAKPDFTTVAVPH